jgi:hypothetical protein
MGRSSIGDLEKKRAELRALLASTGEFRPGSLVERYRRCGKAGCHCAKEGAQGHGPSWSLTHAVDGKTITRVIPPAAVESTRRHVEEYKRFRATVREYIDTSEELCDARLRNADAASEEAAKKGASKRTSTRRSSRK